MSLEKDLFKAYTRPIKEKDLLKALNKSAKSISKRSASAIKQSEEFRLNKKTRDKISKNNQKSAKWLLSLFIRK
ncbi:hypothetical protein ACP6PL_26555 [Dapis sp. BLCC M126]|uniref:hypothetical protein n=1 Tax=Dapis sp. BLCC M126 TaxID=3400189 RepID=UPI003CF5A903